LENTVSIDEAVQDELGYLFSSVVGHGDCFDPLCEIFSGDDNELMAIG